MMLFPLRLPLSPCPKEFEDGRRVLAIEGSTRFAPFLGTSQLPTSLVYTAGIACIGLILPGRFRNTCCCCPSTLICHWHLPPRRLTIRSFSSCIVRFILPFTWGSFAARRRGKLLSAPPEAALGNVVGERERVISRRHRPPRPSFLPSSPFFCICIRAP